MSSLHSRVYTNLSTSLAILNLSLLSFTHIPFTLVCVVHSLLLSFVSLEVREGEGGWWWRRGRTKGEDREAKEGGGDRSQREAEGKEVSEEREKK